MIRLLSTWLVTRRRARRTEFAVAVLRKDAAALRATRGEDRRAQRELARYLDAIADLIERTP